MADTDAKIAEVYRKIEREKLLINGATHMRQSTNNAAVQARADSNIRDGKRNIAYLEEQLNKLQITKVNDGAPPPPAHGYGTGSTQRKPLRQGGMDSGLPTPPPKDAMGYGDGGGMPNSAPYRDPRPNNAPMPKARPNFSKLGKLPRFSLTDTAD